MLQRLRLGQRPETGVHLEKEIEKATGYLDPIEATRKIYVCGNHEDRLERYLKDKAPELLAFVDIPRLLGLAERGWEYVPYRSSTTLGKVHITHDVGSAGRYNVWKALDTFQASAVTGHTHRLGYVVEGNARGRRQVLAQFGWLGDISKVDYLHRSRRSASGHSASATASTTPTQASSTSPQPRS